MSLPTSTVQVFNNHLVPCKGYLQSSKMLIFKMKGHNPYRTLGSSSLFFRVVMERNNKVEVSLTHGKPMSSRKHQTPLSMCNLFLNSNEHRYFIFFHVAMGTKMSTWLTNESVGALKFLSFLNYFYIFFLMVAAERNMITRKL